MRIDLINNKDDIPLDKDSWNALVNKSKTNTIFQTYEWFDCWWDTFGNDYELLFLLATDESSVIGFAPLMISTSKYGIKDVRFIGDANADYCDFVITGNRLVVIEAFLSYLYSIHKKWHSIVLLNIPEYSTTKACLHSCSCNDNYNIQIRNPVATPALLMDGHEQQVGKLIKKYSITRHIKKLNKKGVIEYLHLTDRDEILQHLDHLFNQHIKRYALKNIDSQFIDEKNRNYFVNMVKCFDDTKWLNFSVLKLNGNAIAYHFGFLYKNKLIWYKPTFDVSYMQYSPGTILLKEMIEYSLENSISELDFTIGDEAFKSRFSNVTRYNVNVAIYRSRLLLDFFMIRQFLGFLLNKFSHITKFKI